MRKRKDVSRNEKWMIVAIVVLLLAVGLRWAAVKEGVVRGFKWFDKTERVE
jgi:cell division protein FtsL